MISVLKVMADNNLDAIVHESIEHQPTLISDGVNPSYVNHRGAPHLNTFLSICADDCGTCGIYARPPSNRNQLSLDALMTTAK